MIKKFKATFFLLVGCIVLNNCGPQNKSNAEKTTPTSGKLIVFYEEGLAKAAINQAYTFEAIYSRANLFLVPANENEAIQALYNDSCEAVIITRLLNEKETKAFQSKKYTAKQSKVAETGVALVCNIKLGINKLSYKEVQALIRGNNTITDSLGNKIQVNLIIDKTGSAINNYLVDSLNNGFKLPSCFSTLNSTDSTFSFLKSHTNAIAFIDFAWLSDKDDSLTKTLSKEIKILAIGSKIHNGRYEQPNQSSFKLNTYPFKRSVYVMRKQGEFTLSKGFESFVAGPKGQTMFLKQGLLPSRQQERGVTVKFEALNLKE